MADEPTEQELRDARQIVAGAIAAAGKMESSISWKGRVNALIPEVAALLGDRSPQIRRSLAMMHATVFTTEYLGYETDYRTMGGTKDTSTRLQVKLSHPVDKRHPDGLQLIRTERTDNADGKRMREKLDKIEPGSTVLCWKVQEDMKTGGETMAVLVHVETLPDRKDSAARVTPPSQPRTAPEESLPSGASTTEPSAQSPATAQHESGGGPPPSPDSPSPMKRFDELTMNMQTRTKVAIINDLRSARLWPVTNENLEEVELFVEEWSF